VYAGKQTAAPSATTEDLVRIYLVTDSDVDALLTCIDRDPDHGQDGGSSAHLNDRDRMVYREAHAFYNYQIHKWLDRVRAPQGTVPR
jgi:hypothetical protein